jgi:release factor glutamine methyltransferase
VTTVRAAITVAARQLAHDTARLDAELLMAHLLRVERSALLLKHLDDPLDMAVFDALIARRAAGEPVAYITGTREFWSLPFRVTPDVLIPRPDSETLVEAALERAPVAPRVLDLGTGSGALLLAVLFERPAGWGVGVDASEAAARVAKGNAEALGLDGCASFVAADWDTALNARFDVILANPPYIATGEALPHDVAGFEPHSALYAGDDGLDDYRRIVPRLPHLLSPAGAAHLEIGHTQSDVLTALANAAGLVATLRRDLAGKPRCLTCRLAN